MEDIYINENVIYNINNKTLYNNNKKKTKITNNNWYKYLNNYGWSRLNSNRLNENKYAILDCGFDGDCLYACICEALNNPLHFTGVIYSIKYLRELTAEQVNNENFEEILLSYKLLKDSDDFIGEWDPYSVNTIDDLKKQIIISGNNFWADYNTIILLQKVLKLNIIILNNQDFTKVYSLGTDFNYTDHHLK